jgi:hypothetical protein
LNFNGTADVILARDGWHWPAQCAAAQRQAIYNSYTDTQL